MCAIAGLVYEPGRIPNAAACLREMLRLQAHRGPDGNGCYEALGVALGHCRLSIIDLSDAGRQPMSDIEGRFHLTFNGEIYNYVELRAELASRGYDFRGCSDSEVLLVAYQHWGENCVDHLRGMFAFAVWDTRSRTLFAARDRLGIKPFHYIAEEGYFAFASELKALLPIAQSLTINSDLARDYLAYNVLDHQPDATMFREIRRLPPAHSLRWREGVGIDVRCYWEVTFNGALTVGGAERRNLVLGFRDAFNETMSLHLRSDVPIGTCLSGGLDSSSIVCVANAMLRQCGDWAAGSQHTFSACFEKRELDERPYIHAVTEAVQCQSRLVFPNGELLREDLEQWLWHQEEPVGGTGTYAHYCVARLASEHGIKVLLDGQGADEQLAGYRKFILVYLRQLWTGGKHAKAIKEAVAFFGSPEILKTCSFVDGRRYLLRTLTENEVLFPNGVPPPPEGLGIGASLARRLEADVKQFSLPVLLRYEDRNTMAFGIESRVPFVDHKLVEFMAALPCDLRLSRGWTKCILREALADILPPKVRRRKTKLGFSTPESDWLGGALAGWLKETLIQSEFVEAFVEGKGVDMLLRRFISGNRDGALLQVLFRLAVFETWARIYFGKANEFRRLARTSTTEVVHG